jgi:hypothetical protein
MKKPVQISDPNNVRSDACADVPRGRAQRPDFTLRKLHSAVVRLPSHAQQPLDDGVDVETRTRHLACAVPSFVTRTVQLRPAGERVMRVRRGPQTRVEALDSRTDSVDSLFRRDRGRRDLPDAGR